jgi:hypothetical protein
MVAMAEDAINFIVQLVMYDLRKPANQFVINLLYLLVW